MAKGEEVFENALLGRHVPILPLDNKWHRLMVGLKKTAEMKEAEDAIKELLKRQGKLNTDIKTIKRKKQQLMEEIVGGMEDSAAQASADDKKKQIEVCNQTLDKYAEELHLLPEKIGEYNYVLMLGTMQQCYEMIQENTELIDEIAKWIADIRIELKKNIVRKQERELKNQEIYSYMHDIFGPDVIDIFDMKYNPGENMLKANEKKD